MPGNDGAAPIVLIDGRSGSGKTELAAQLAECWPGSALIRLDDIYPGWDGLAAGARHVHDHILLPLASASTARWQAWNWATNEPGEWRDVRHFRALIIEGCGSLSRENRALATFGVWVELDEPTRKVRALARDGAGYLPYWDRWAAQEQDYIDREHPAEHADLVVDGNLGVPAETLRSLVNSSPVRAVAHRRSHRNALSRGRG